LGEKTTADRLSESQSIPHGTASAFPFSRFICYGERALVTLCCGKEPHAPVIVPIASDRVQTQIAAIGGSGLGYYAMKNPEPGLLEGFLLCLRDSEAILIQTSEWKRNLLFFSSGVCLEISALPLLANWLGYELPWLFWTITSFFFPLGLLGIYASKFGNDRLVERLLVVPKLDLKI
jgi:hypothetical protein